jgi:hypothetical protein
MKNEDVLLLPATLNRHKNAAPECRGIRLLGSPLSYAYNACLLCTMAYYPSFYV